MKTVTAHGDVCSFEPACQTREEMRQRHGTPQAFANAVWSALGEISLAEALDAIDRYKREFALARSDN